MLEILQIKERIAVVPYRDGNSFFELRMMLMDAASLLTSKHISNLRQDKDPIRSQKLLQAFRRVRHYYFMLEKADNRDVECFTESRNKVVEELAAVCQVLKGAIIPLDKSVLSIAR